MPNFLAARSITACKIFSPLTPTSSAYINRTSHPALLVVEQSVATEDTVDGVAGIELVGESGHGDLGTENSETAGEESALPGVLPWRVHLAKCFVKRPLSGGEAGVVGVEIKLTDEAGI